MQEWVILNNSRVHTNYYSKDLMIQNKYKVNSHSSLFTDTNCESRCY